MFINEVSAESFGDVLHIDVLLQCRQNLGGLQDVELLDRVGVHPFLDPGPDGRKVGRCSYDLIFANQRYHVC